MLGGANVDNDDGANADNTIFTIEDRKLYVPVVTLSPKGNSKPSKVLSLGFERSVYWYYQKL